MHLSDGLLDPTTAIVTSAAAVGALGVCVRQLQREGLSGADSATQPAAQSTITAGKMALVGAGVFAIQAVNFPLSENVSGHLLGGVAAAALLGPWAGALVVAAVLAVQCFLLGDGGVSALGANVLNMAVLGALLGGPIHAMSRRGAAASRVALAGGLAAAASLPLGAVACAAEMHFAEKASFAATSGQMLPLHFMLAVAEGLFTAAAILSTQRSTAWNAANRSAIRWCGFALVAVLVATAVLVPYSSSLPDTLEAAVEHVGASAFEPYLAAAIGDETFAAAGAWAAAVVPVLLGTVLAFAASGVLARGVDRSRVAVRRHD